MVKTLTWVSVVLAKLHFRSFSSNRITFRLGIIMIKDRFITLSHTSGDDNAAIKLSECRCSCVNGINIYLQAEGIFEDEGIGEDEGNYSRSASSNEGVPSKSTRASAERTS